MEAVSLPVTVFGCGWRVWEVSDISTPAAAVATCEWGPRLSEEMEH